MGQTDEPAPHDVICKDGLVLVESSTNQIECIHETTAQKMGGMWRVMYMIKHWKSFMKKCFKDRNILTLELLTILSQVNT